MGINVEVVQLIVFVFKSSMASFSSLRIRKYLRVHPKILLFHRTSIWRQSQVCNNCFFIIEINKSLKAAENLKNIYLPNKYE